MVFERIPTQNNPQEKPNEQNKEEQEWLIKNLKRLKELEFRKKKIEEEIKKLEEIRQKRKTNNDWEIISKLPRDTLKLLGLDYNTINYITLLQGEEEIFPIQEENVYDKQRKKERENIIKEIFTIVQTKLENLQLEQKLLTQEISDLERILKEQFEFTSLEEENLEFPLDEAIKKQEQQEREHIRRIIDELRRLHGGQSREWTGLPQEEGEPQQQEQPNESLEWTDFPLEDEPDTERGNL